MFTRTSLCVALFVALTATSVEAQSFRQLGTRRGAITGAVIGGIIGGQNDEVAAGIIAGGLVGGVTGRVVGTRIDQRAAYQYGGYGYQQPRYNYQPKPYYQTQARPVYRPPTPYYGGFQQRVPQSYGRYYAPQQQFYRGW